MAFNIAKKSEIGGGSGGCSNSGGATATPTTEIEAGVSGVSVCAPGRIVSENDDHDSDDSDDSDASDDTITISGAEVVL